MSHMKKFLNFGSLNIDNVYSVDHFVQAGETLAPFSFEMFPGGKGLNQSIALARSGAEVWHAGRVGPDGEWLVKLLAESGVHAEEIDRTGKRSGHAVIQVNPQGQNCILLDGGANMQIPESYIETSLAPFGRGDCLVLQNEVNSLPEIIRRAAQRGMDIALNPSPITDELYAMDFSAVTWLILNDLEGEVLTGEQQPQEMARALLARYPHMRIVLTMGSAGVLYRDAQESHTHGIFHVPVVDTTGAGDTFTGYFLSAVVGQRPVAEALRIASAASAIAVSHKGAAVSIPTSEEVKRFLSTCEENRG